MVEEELVERIRDRLRDRPVAFAKVMCGLDLTDYQKDALRDDSKRILFLCSRRVGKSTVCAVKALYKAWTCDDRFEVIVIAPTLRQAQIIYEKIYDWVSGNRVFLETTRRLNMSKIEFDNGGVIRCLPAGRRGETCRGFAADMLIIDEAQSVPEEVFISIVPSTIDKNGQVVVLGTPSYGRSGMLWQLWQDDEWKKYRWTWDMSPFISEDEVMKFRQTFGEAAYRREFLAEFFESSDLFFPNEIVMRSMRIENMNWRPKDGWIYTCGIDFGLRHDKTAMCMLGKCGEDGDVYEVHGLWRYGSETQDMSLVVKRAVERIKRFRPEVVVCDDTSGWVTAVDMLKERLGKEDIEVRVEGFNFAKTKERKRLYMNLRLLLEDERIMLPNDATLLEEFQSFKVKMSKSGEEIIKKTGRFDDRVDAIAMAAWGMDKRIGGKAYVADFILDSGFL